MRLTRMTTRRWILLVGAVALALAGGGEAFRWYRLSRIHARKAAALLAQERSLRSWAIKYDKLAADSAWTAARYWTMAQEARREDRWREEMRRRGMFVRGATSMVPQFEKLALSTGQVAESLERLAQDRRKETDVQALLRARYEHAASHPWEDVPPARPPARTGRLVGPGF